MKITPNSSTYQLQNQPQKEHGKKESTVKNIQTPRQQVDEYIPSKPIESGVYQKPTSQADAGMIAKLKAESEKNYEHLRSLVKQMLQDQGITFQDVLSGRKEFVVDETTRTQAEAAISEGGPLSAENVSDNIVAFAKAISGGDKSKFDILKDAIEDGFNAAKDVLGGTLPEISQQTYDLVMEKLDQWMEE